MSPTGSKPEVGFVLGSNFGPAQLIPVAKALEANGFDTVWNSEDYFLTGGVSGAAVVLGATETIKVGTGVLSVYARHPALTAMDAATLTDAYPDRFRLGVGTGVFHWLDQQGLPHEKPLGTMRAYIETTRRLLAGEEVHGDFGGFHFDHVKLSFPPAYVAPLYVGATGPMMTKLTGELADGLLLSVFASPAFFKIEADLMACASPAGAAAKPISTFALFSFADTIEQARSKARPVMAFYLAAGGGNVMTEVLGINDELEALAKQGPDVMASEMPDEWIDQLGIVGDLDTCLARIAEFGAAGCAEIALAPINVDSMISDIEKLGAVLTTW
jgi:5,10-methylenetetrahydromethanopterin reductase